MTSVLAERPAYQGQQEPRFCSLPPAASSAGDEAVELAKMAGLILDPWEEFVLSRALGEGDDGKWAAFEVGMIVSRQNGKGAILEARELAGLFLLGERLLIHSAHQFDTSLEAFRRLLNLIEETPDFDRRVKRISRSHGEEGIELKNGQRIRFRTRTKGGGRGFSCDCLILDEAMVLTEAAHGALLPTLSARPNPQVWYTGSAVDQWVHEHGIVLSRIRERGLKGDEPGLAYFEWSAEADNPDDLGKTAQDPEAWAAANPGLGIRISSEHIAREQRSMDPRTFAVERLGVGDWPQTDGLAQQVISKAMWDACADPGSVVVDPVHFAFDVTPDRTSGSISVAGKREDGHSHIEVIERKRGTGWIVPRLAELMDAHQAAGLICDGASPAAALLNQLAQLNLEPQVLSAKEYGQACGAFYDAFEQRSIRHLGTPELTGAIKGAAKRPLGDSWAWSRTKSGVDISPLVACTLALWASEQSAGVSTYEEKDLLVL